MKHFRFVALLLSGLRSEKPTRARARSGRGQRRSRRGLPGPGPHHHYRPPYAIRGSRNLAYDRHGRGQIVGTSENLARVELTRPWTGVNWTPDSGTWPEGRSSAVFGINDGVQLIGCGRTASDEEHTAGSTLLALRPRSELVLALAADAQSLVPQGKLPPAEACRLVHTTERALCLLGRYGPRSAATALRIFLQIAEDLIASGRLARSDGQPLINLANCAVTRLSA